MKKASLLLLCILTLILLLSGCNNTEPDLPDTPEQTECAHLNTEWVTEGEPTCLQDGYKTKYCNDCRQTLSERQTISALGHAFEEDRCTRCPSIYIRNTAGLFAFAEAVEAGETFENAEVILLDDLDLSQQVWIPVGAVSGTPFAGSFLGGDHTISNLTLSPGEYETNGISFLLTNNGTVRDLTLASVNLTFDRSGTEQAGLLAAVNNGRIENCHVTGIIEGVTTTGGAGLTTWCHAGGLAAINKGEIVASSALVPLNIRTEQEVRSGVIAGGLVGKNEGQGVISDCFATGSVSAYGWVGARAGGLIGSNIGSVTHCFATGDVHTTASATIEIFSAAGSLIGNSSIGLGSKAKVIGCFATGNALAEGGDNAFAGTLIASAMKNVEQTEACYTAKEATAQAQTAYVDKNGTPGVSTLHTEGTAVPSSQFSSPALFTETLQWSGELWAFEEGSLPALK